MVGPYTYTNLLENFSRFIPQWFDDVSLQYNRQDKLNFLIDEEYNNNLYTNLDNLHLVKMD